MRMKISSTAFANDNVYQWVGTSEIFCVHICLVDILLYCRLWVANTAFHVE